MEINQKGEGKHSRQREQHVQSQGQTECGVPRGTEGGACSWSRVHDGTRVAREAGDGQGLGPAGLDVLQAWMSWRPMWWGTWEAMKREYELLQRSQALVSIRWGSGAKSRAEGAGKSAQGGLRPCGTPPKRSFTGGRLGPTCRRASSQMAGPHAGG